VRQADNESDRGIEQWSQVPVKIDISSRSVGCQTKDDKKAQPRRLSLLIRHPALNDQIYIPKEFLGINLLLKQF